MIKKIAYAILIVLVLGVLANAGYRIGEGWASTQKAEKPTIVQRFLAGPDGLFVIDQKSMLMDPVIRRITFSVLGIIFFLPVAILIWFTYFLFFGGLFSLVGAIPSVLATFASIGIVVILFKRRHKPTTT